MPKPKNISGKTQAWVASGTPARAMLSIAKVGEPDWKKSTRMPTTISAEPPISIRVSFIAEYSFGPVPQRPISRYIGSTAIS